MAVAGETDPVWLGEEIGIIATGAGLMSVGLMLARPTPARRGERAALSA